MKNDDFIDTTRAAHFLGGISRRTLEKYRVIGGGPAFHKFGARVLYRMNDLEKWAESRRRISTSDQGLT